MEGGPAAAALTTGTSTYRAANADMATAAARQVLRGGPDSVRAAGLSGLHGKGQGAHISAAELARQDSIHLGDVPRCFDTNSADATPLHPAEAYLNRIPPVDPSSWAGVASSASGSSGAEGAAGAAKRSGVNSAVCFGYEPTQYVTDMMDGTCQRQEERKRSQPFVPVATNIKYARPAAQ